MTPTVMSPVVAVVIQPNYIPWIGYFDLLARSTVTVWLVEAQFTKRDWRNRNRVAGDGEPLWLTVPVKTKGRYEQSIEETEIDHRTHWARKHLRTFDSLYRRAPYFEPTRELLRETLEHDFERLADLTIQLNESICRRLDLPVRFVGSPAIARHATTKTGRLVEICRAVGADTYLSGPAAAGYLDTELLAASGIALRWMTYDYPSYPRGGQRPIGNLSVLDPLAWIGVEGTRGLLRGGSGPLEALR